MSVRMTGSSQCTERLLPVDEGRFGTAPRGPSEPGRWAGHGAGGGCGSLAALCHHVFRHPGFCAAGTDLGLVLVRGLRLLELEIKDFGHRPFVKRPAVLCYSVWKAGPRPTLVPFAGAGAPG